MRLRDKAAGDAAGVADLLTGFPGLVRVSWTAARRQHPEEE